MGSERFERAGTSNFLEIVGGFEKTGGLKKESDGLKNKIDCLKKHVGDLKQTEDCETRVEDLKEHTGISDKLSPFKQVGSLQLEEVSGWLEQMMVKVQEVVEQHFSGCHLVLATITQLNPSFFWILRRLADEGIVVVVAEALFSENHLAQEYLLQGLWRSSTFTCQTLILYLNDANTNIAFRFLEESRLWLHPQTVVVLVGEQDRMEALLHHPSLRNSIHTLYMAVDWSNHSRTSVNIWLKREAVNKDNTAGGTNVERNFPAGEISVERNYPAGGTNVVRNYPTEGAKVVKNYAAAGANVMRNYRRCLYCDNGEAGIQLLSKGNLFPETLQNMMGHRFKVVSRSFCPVLEYRKVSEDPGIPVVPLDSLDIRILDAIAARFNFTYELREPLDGEWGSLTTGNNWSGIVGTLQHERADFSLDITLSPSREEAMAYSIIYFYDPYRIVSLQPKLLPRHLALIRPFTGKIWTLIVVFTLLTGVSLWALQKVWSWVSSTRTYDFYSALFSVWGLLLENTPSCPPTNISSQMLVGWWLLSCLVLGTAYRSSLIAHLSVQGKTELINSFEDILKRNNWSWGFKRVQGASRQFFEQNTDPVYLKIFKDSKKCNVTGEGAKRVLAGRFSYIAFESEIRCIIFPLHVDNHGYSPFYISTTKYPAVSWNTWGFRKGAPIIGLVSRMKQRMIETGLIDHWLDDLFKAETKRIREALGMKTTLFTKMDNEELVVLGMDHLQGAFYIWLLGITIAFLSFLGENFAHCNTHFLRTHSWKRETSGASRCIETDLLKPDLNESDPDDPGSLDPSLLASGFPAQSP
ncbi:uncharacterized protein [Cherax quadricarinatus]|uniref:uncharacterized protein n=1 Tax=Cherax quadricarinatus TaxID=27406 RepID=UPI00387EACBD